MAAAEENNIIFVQVVEKYPCLYDPTAKGYSQKNVTDKAWYAVFVDCKASDSLSQHPLLLIVSYDGFRHNYFEKQVTPTLQKLKTLGTHAEYMRNVFETKTFPNHHSIATGLFPEVHGVLANSLYDPIYKRVLNFSYELWHQNENIIPIWNYNTSISWEERVDTAIGWFLHPVTPANLVMLYIEEPDASSHIFGPESQQVLKQLAKLDQLTDYLQHRLVDNNLSDVVNVFHLSDHGMDTVTLDRIVNLTDYVDRSTYITSGSSPVLGLVPLNKGELLVWTIAPHTKYNEEHIYKSLKNASLHDNFRVFKRADIPERWHFKNNNPNMNTTLGIHGYDNAESNMHPYFIACGPLIKKNHVIAPFDTVDLYSLFAHILNVSAPPNNGSLANVVDMLVVMPSHLTATPSVFFMGEPLILFQ
uniref:MADF domain-containing protein n=1 Tax=Timema bartmani TaxID=61472 RepID=A0A7R9I0H6_9NEOP|nr:unnamed protein product [Timema bartmani]